MIKDDGHVLHFTNPKVQASLTANTFAITGNCEEKREPRYSYRCRAGYQDTDGLGWPRNPDTVLVARPPRNPDSAWWARA